MGGQYIGEGQESDVCNWSSHPDCAPHPEYSDNEDAFLCDTNNDGFERGKKVLLKFKGQNLAILVIESKWEPDKELEAQL